MDFPFFDDLSDEERALIAYEFEARMYVMSHIGDVTQKYAEYIFEKLCKQNSEIEMYWMGKFVNGTYGKDRACDVIKSYTELTADAVILYNPATEQPAIVEDVFQFTDYDIQAYEYKMFIEYMNQRNSKQFDTNRTPIGLVDLAKAKTKQAATGYAMYNTGNKIVSKASRFDTLAKHYQGGHAMQMRINKSVRGATEQKRIMQQMIFKQKKLVKASKVYKLVGGKLKLSGIKKIGGILKPVSFADIFLSPTMFAVSDLTIPEKKRMERIIPQELAKYCYKNDNYNIQYFNQG